MAEKRFAIRTFGCQMNAHDSEKVANLLLHAGWAAAGGAEAADLLVVNTCSVREKAEHKLYSDLGLLRRWKEEQPGRLVGVGGCVAQQEGDLLLARFPQVDFVFGTHNLRLVPALADAALAGQRRAETGEQRDLARFDLPGRHPALSSETPGRAFVTVMEGCDMFCSFCIVPHTRGREISRPAEAIVREVEALAAGGVVEVTLLGQTVNAYGRHDRRRGHAERTGTVAFAELLHRLDAVPGLRRLRYTSPHPIFFDDALIAAHGALATLQPHVHLPAQSGSDAVLARMRRRYRADDVRALAARLRAARPDLVLTTDLIVGFPGESERDFEDTLALVRDVGFVDAYSFKYSPRPGTAAAAGESEGSVPAGEAQARLEALQALQRGLTIAYHRGRVGSRTEVLVEGPSRKGGGLQGRDPQHRIVHLEAEPGAGGDPGPRTGPGALVEVRIAEATPHSLLGTPCAPGASGELPEPPRAFLSGAAASGR
ncbi:MAG: tRNA (N6-isopentenyl adenosine(37)-C2)-methylthiotransferase MiaB [Deltaproteobacteria bacterium]|nr:tRNA (N6-isopentenyl adenosine(37)-C2)-methylthiotransferase MiaB [Deltaproteobacteria bacterium]